MTANKYYVLSYPENIYHRMSLNCLSRKDFIKKIRSLSGIISSFHIWIAPVGPIYNIYDETRIALDKFIPPTCIKYENEAKYN